MFKASAAAMERIVEVRKKIRIAITEGERDFVDFLDTKTGEALREALEILDRHEGFTRLAESSKHGYKLLDRLEENKNMYDILKDPELVKRAIAAEKELDEEEF